MHWTLVYLYLYLCRVHSCVCSEDCAMLWLWPTVRRVPYDDRCVIYNSAVSPIPREDFPFGVSCSPSPKSDWLRAWNASKTEPKVGRYVKKKSIVGSRKCHSAFYKLFQTHSPQVELFVCALFKEVYFKWVWVVFMEWMGLINGQHFLLPLHTFSISQKLPNLFTVQSFPHKRTTGADLMWTLHSAAAGSCH